MEGRVCCGPDGTQTVKEPSEGLLLDPCNLRECWRANTVKASQQSSEQGYLEPHAPKTETSSSWARAKSLEKIYEIWAAQREQKGVISLPPNELPWLFHGSTMLQKFMAKFYNTNSWRYMEILGGVYSNFSHSADCRKHWKYVMWWAKRQSVFCSAKKTAIQVGQNCPRWDPCQ